MNQIMLSSFFLLCLISAGTMSCSKKVTKLQQSPQQAKQEKEYSTNNSLKPNDNEISNNSIKEIFVPILFEYNQAEITSSEIKKLERIAACLNENKQIRVVVEGHCDERGSSEYNMGLGEKRATAVQNWLSAYGISKSRVDVTSYGEENLIATGCDDESCHYQNRRDEWKVFKN